jgi:hypothetical protein
MVAVMPCDVLVLHGGRLLLGSGLQRGVHARDARDSGAEQRAAGEQDHDGCATAEA